MHPAEAAPFLVVCRYAPPALVAAAVHAVHCTNISQRIPFADKEKAAASRLLFLFKGSAPDCQGRGQLQLQLLFLNYYQLLYRKFLYLLY